MIAVYKVVADFFIFSLYPYKKCPAEIKYFAGCAWCLPVLTKNKNYSHDMETSIFLLNVMNLELRPFTLAKIKRLTFVF